MLNTVNNHALLSIKRNGDRDEIHKTSNGLQLVAGLLAGPVLPVRMATKQRFAFRHTMPWTIPLRLIYQEWEDDVETMSNGSIRH